MGANEKMGAIAVGDYVKTGQTVQFHVRDAATADEDLSCCSRRSRPAGRRRAACCSVATAGGRACSSRPCHDVAASLAALPPTPVAGFFAAGEFGPVGGKNFVHGHTASFALLRPGK